MTFPDNKIGTCSIHVLDLSDPPRSGSVIKVVEYQCSDCRKSSKVEHGHLSTPPHRDSIWRFVIHRLLLLLFMQALIAASFNMVSVIGRHPFGDP